jgi:hypothetical protein
MGCKEMEDYPYPEKETGEGSLSSHSEGSDKCGCSANPCGGPYSKEEVKLDPRAPNMTALLEAVAITVEERVRQLMNYYGLPIPESKENIQGHVATKRTEYIKSNPVRPELKKDKPYLVKKESFQQKLERKRTLHKPEAAKKLEAPKKAKRGNLNFRELDPVENRRVYVFPGNHRVIVENACRLAITDSGVHRLETTTGEKHIIPAGWLQIKINAPAWSF